MGTHRERGGPEEMTLWNNLTSSGKGPGSSSEGRNSDEGGHGDRCEGNHRNKQQAGYNRKKRQMQYRINNYKKEK